MPRSASPMQGDKVFRRLLACPFGLRWQGRVCGGLHRFDRRMGVWTSYERQDDGKIVIGGCVKRIWQEEPRIYVEHDVIGNHAFFYLDFSDGRGIHWTRA